MMTDEQVAAAGRCVSEDCFPDCPWAEVDLCREHVIGCLLSDRAELVRENADLRAELKRTDEMFTKAAADERLYRERLADVATERDELMREVERLRDCVETTRDVAVENIAANATRINALEAENERLREALQAEHDLLDDRQWQDVAEGRWAYCQTCGHESCGHERDCSLKLALERGEAALAGKKEA